MIIRGDKRRKKGRNFWWDWREERRKRWEKCHSDEDEGEHHPPPPEMAEAWRGFFHNFTGDWPEEHWAFGGRRFKPWHQGRDNFNPFVANLFSQGGGLLPLVVLHQLAEQPRYANEIMSQLTERTGGQWVANPGAIYPLMNELEKRGFVTSEWEDPRKRTIRMYKLTDLGQQELGRVKAIVRPKLNEAIELLQNLVIDFGEM